MKEINITKDEDKGSLCWEAGMLLILKGIITFW